MNFRNRVYKLQCGETARLPVHIVGSPASHDKSTASKGYIPPHLMRFTKLPTNVGTRACCELQSHSLIFKTTRDAWNRPHPSRPVRKSNRCQGKNFYCSMFCYVFTRNDCLNDSCQPVTYGISRSGLWGGGPCCHKDTPKLLHLNRNLIV